MYKANTKHGTTNNDKNRKNRVKHTSFSSKRSIWKERKNESCNNRLINNTLLQNLHSEFIRPTKNSAHLR